MSGMQPLWRALPAGAGGQVQHEMFGGAALYVTPFVSPNGNFSFQRKELEELDPERNQGYPSGAADPHQPAEYFVWAAKECRAVAGRR